MGYPRHFGHSGHLARGRLHHADWSDEQWALGALFGLFLLGVIGLYALSGDHPKVAMVPADETTGQSVRPTLPSLPQ